MKKTKRFLSSIMALLMVFSVVSVGFTATAAEANGAILDEIVLEPIARPDVSFTCTPVTRVAAAANSLEPGNTIVKATPSGVPELSGSYAAQAYAGETPTATKISFQSNTVGVTPGEIKCSNDTIALSSMQYDAATGTYNCEIISGTAEAGEAITFTIDYEWTDGNSYQEKCVTYVENIVTGGSYAYLELVYKPMSGLGSWYIGSASAVTRLLGKGVYYEQPANFTASTEDPYNSYGVYNVATGSYIDTVASGYNTHLYTNDRNVKVAGTPREEASCEEYIGDTPTAHIYVDSSATSTLADINLRLDGNVSNLSDRNNDNPYTALDSVWVMAGAHNSQPGTIANDAAAQAALGYNFPAKSDKGVKEKLSGDNGEQARQTVTGPVGQFGNLYTYGFNGNVSGLADGSSYTVINKYYSFFRPRNAYVTASPTVPTVMTFHIVDKGALREIIDYAMNSEPEVPTIRATKKGANPQAWFYQTGFSQFQSAYTEALRVLNNPRAIQSDVDAAAKSLRTMYNNLKLKAADYSRVNDLNDQADAILENADCYDPADIALIEEAQDMVAKNYSILYQGAVDTMADNIETAIKNATPRGADYTDVYAAKMKAEELSSEDYTDTSWQALQDALNAVVYGKTAFEQDEVDAMAQAIEDAIANLELVTADFSALKTKLAEVKAINRALYTNANVLDVPVANAESAIAEHEVTAWDEERQPEVDALVSALETAVKSLKLKPADKTALKAAIDAEIPGNIEYYDPQILAQYDALLVEGTEMYNDDSLTINDQSSVTEKTNEITAKYAQLMASYDESCRHVAGDAVVENNVEPTCVRSGSYDTVTYCIKCGEEISRKKIIVPAAGHTEGEAVVENEVAADCVTEGKYDTVVYCTVCNTVISRKTTKIPATGHTPGEEVIENVTDGDCTTQGSYDTVVYCTVCDGEVSRVTTKTDALGHKAGEAVKENEVAPTCTDEGSYDMVAYCTVCGEEASKETFTIDALGHTEGEAVVENEVAADCVNDGSYDTVVYCTVCDAEVSRETTVVDALGHTPAEAVEENRVDATYTEAGSYESVVYCSVCGEELSRETVVIPMLDGYFKVQEGSTTVIDTELGFIYGLDVGLNDIEDYVDYSESVTVELSDGVGTGSIVTTYRDGAEWETYTIVIFGDLNGDSVIDIYDATILAAVVNGDIELEEGSAQAFAADLNGDTVADIYDLAILNAVVNGEIEIGQVPLA